MDTIRTSLHTFFLSKTIHWKLLLFLVLFLNVKLVVKLAAVVLLYCLQPNFRFGLKLKDSRLSLFYPVVILIALLNVFLHQPLFQVNYLVVLLFGIAIWTTCFLVSHQLKHIVETADSGTIHRTLVLFFLLNAGVSAIQLLLIVFETGAINPFLYQGNYQKYFISTGDYIKGLSFDTSTTNAILNAFGMIFFLYRRNWPLLLLCTCILLLTGSNLVNILIYLTLLFMFLFHSSREQKSFIVICVALLVIFMAKVSPQNNQYAVNAIEKLLQPPAGKSTSPKEQADGRGQNLTEQQHKKIIAERYLDSLRNVMASRFAAAQDRSVPLSLASFNEKPTLPAPDIHSAPFQNRDDTNAYRRELLAFGATGSLPAQSDTFYTNKKLSGKVIAFLQTGNYFLERPYLLLTGAGLGNFSSKMAFKATALQFAGGYPQELAYIHPDFSPNHLRLYRYFFSKRASAHSVTNSPNSVYDQLFSEYGVAGLGAFLLFYVGYFLKHRKKLTYGLPLIFLLLGFFFMDYWFEQLSIVVLFELLLFLNIQETSSS